MVLEYRVNWTYGTGSPGVSVFHGREGAGALLSDAAQDLADRVHTFFEALALSLANTVTFTFPDEVLELDTTTGELTEVVGVDGGSAVVGAQSGSLVAAPAGAVITWRTAAVVAGRRLIGRTFVVPLPAVNYENNGTLNGDAIASLTAAAEAFIDGSVGTSVDISVWSRTHGIQADIQSVSVPDKVAVLRSRRD